MADMGAQMGDTITIMDITRVRAQREIHIMRSNDIE